MSTCLVLGFIGVLKGGLKKKLVESNQGTIKEYFRVWSCVTALQLSSCKGLVCSYVLIIARICKFSPVFNVFLLSITIDFLKKIPIDSDSKNL